MEAFDEHNAGKAYVAVRKIATKNAVSEVQKVTEEIT